MSFYYTLVVWVKIFDCHPRSKGKPKAIGLFLFFLFSFLCFIHKTKDYLICSSYHWVSWEAKVVPCSCGCHSIWPRSSLPRCDPALCCKPRGFINGLLNSIQNFQLKNWKQNSQTLLDGFLAGAGLCQVSEEQGGHKLSHGHPHSEEIKQSSLPVPLEYILLSFNVLGF